MNRRLVIDMMKCRECDACTAECSYPLRQENHGINDLLEMASFQFTCRRCEEAPCVEVCPSGALERNTEGIVDRFASLCVACKSCVVICPFGTLMNHFFDIRKSICDYCRFDEQTDTLRCVETCPKGALSFIEAHPDADNHLFEMNDRVIVRDYAWEKLKETE